MARRRMIGCWLHHPGHVATESPSRAELGSVGPKLWPGVPWLGRQVANDESLASIRLRTTLFPRTPDQAGWLPTWSNPACPKEDRSAQHPASLFGIFGGERRSGAFTPRALASQMQVCVGGATGALMKQGMSPSPISRQLQQMPQALLASGWARRLRCAICTKARKLHLPPFLRR